MRLSILLTSILSSLAVSASLVLPSSAAETSQLSVTEIAKRATVGCSQCVQGTISGAPTKKVILATLTDASCAPFAKATFKLSPAGSATGTIKTVTGATSTTVAGSWSGQTLYVKAIIPGQPLISMEIKWNAAGAVVGGWKYL